MFKCVARLLSLPTTHRQTQSYGRIYGCLSDFLCMQLHSTRTNQSKEQRDVFIAMEIGQWGSSPYPSKKNAAMASININKICRICLKKHENIWCYTNRPLLSCCSLCCLTPSQLCPNGAKIISKCLSAPGSIKHTIK